MRKHVSRLLILFSVILIETADNGIHAQSILDNSTPPTVLVTCKPEEVGMSTQILNRIDGVVAEGIQARAFPGCQVVVLKKGKAVYNKCFGNCTYEAEKKVTPNTLYDLASLSKTTGTLLAIMKLYDQGRLKLTDKASHYLSFLRGTDKEELTITDLLFHESGLPGSLSFHKLVIEKNNTLPFLMATKDTTHTVRMSDPTLKYKEDWVSKISTPEFTIQVSDSFYLHNRFHDAAMQMLATTPLRSKTYLYSCLNFILLKEIAETISGTSMDVFLDTEFYKPMQLNSILYLPLRKFKKEDIAPTLMKDNLRNGVIQGFVHDPAAAFLGGISGNAGLFARAQDVAVVYQMLQNGGEMSGRRYLSLETCKLFITTASASGRRYLGFDKSLPQKIGDSPCCELAPTEVYGHTGYTGTCCWVDPVNELVYIFLSNRTYPNDGKNKLAQMRIRPRIQEIVYQSNIKN